MLYRSSPPTRRVRTAREVTVALCLWLLASFLLSAFLGKALGVMIAPILIGAEHRLPENQVASGALDAACTLPLWLLGGWWYGGWRLGRSSLFANRSEVLPLLSGVGVLVWVALGGVAAYQILTGGPGEYPIWRGVTLERFMVGWLGALVMWAAAWYGLGWLCLPDGWHPEAIEMVLDGELDGAAGLLDDVERHSGVMSARDRALLANAKSELEASVTAASAKGAVGNRIQV
jgi:hypothetical protein